MKRLDAGEVIIGDGSYTMTLEKRGYALGNANTSEASVEHPEAVRQLAIEYARAGADITQTYTFFSDDQRLKEWHGEQVPTVRKINRRGKYPFLGGKYSSLGKEISILERKHCSLGKIFIK